MVVFRWHNELEGTLTPTDFRSLQRRVIRQAITPGQKDEKEFEINVPADVKGAKPKINVRKITFSTMFSHFCMPQVKYDDPLWLATELLQDPDLDGDIRMKFKELTKNGDRVYKELNNGEWWEKTESEEVPPVCHFIVIL
jgi:hypothetical protein